MNKRLTQLAALQHAHPWRFVLVAFVLATLALPSVLRLRVDGNLQAMLPTSAPSVRDLGEIRERVGQPTTLALAVRATGDSPDRERLHAFVTSLAAELGRRGDLRVVSVDSNIADFREFATQRRFLYADENDLVALRDALKARLDWEREHANPLYDDDSPLPDIDGPTQRLRGHASEARARANRFPDGFYEHPTLPVDFIIIRTSIQATEPDATARLIAGVEETATKIAGHVHRTRTAGSDVGWVGDAIRIDYGADLMDMSEENAALQGDVAKSGLVTLALLVAVVWIFFRRARAIPLLLGVLVPPCIITFGCAQLVVHALNTSTAFLGSIVIGNGVNASIMWLGRYFEARRGGAVGADAIAIAHRGTWAGTLAATLAAVLAYGSLAVTDYRGFRDFGFIGALGMLLCWIAAYALLAALVTLGERRWPMHLGAQRERKGIYGVLFARLALRSPRLVLGCFAALSVGAVMALTAAARDPLEYDFRNLQARRPAASHVLWVNERLAETVEETRAGGALAVVARSEADIPAIRAQLEAYRAQHPEDLGALRTIDDLLPANQGAKIPMLAELRALLLEARSYVTDDQQALIDANLPPEHIVAVGAADLPAGVARPFTERDGARGRILYVEHADGKDTWDGRYMIRWAAAARAAVPGSGNAPCVAGGAPVFADLLTSIFHDGPKVIGLSLLLTVCLLAFVFRAGRERFLAVASMLAAVLWMVGALAATGTKINFLNLVALPVTFGIGVEYSVNYLKRYLEERRQGVDAARVSLEGAGGAVVLCSLTTLIGYVSLYASSARALNTFGLAMTLGELSSIAAAVVALPALLHVLDKPAHHAAEPVLS